MGIYFESELVQRFKGGPVAVRHRLASREQQIGIEIHSPRGGHGGVQGAKPTRRGITWIGETSQALLLALGVQPLEGPAIHHGFAAHFEFRPIGGDVERERANGASIFGDVLSHQAIAARHRLGELSIAIMRGHGKPVQLQFRHIVDVSDPVQEIAQLSFIQRVVEAEHLGRVPYFDETLARLAADALSG